MKKILITLFATMLIGSVFADSSLVYDFRASIKRLDMKLKYISREHMIAQSFNTKSDTIKGYVVLPSCTSCEGNVFSTVDEDYVGYAYVLLTGVSKTVNEERIVMKVPVKAHSAIFGSDMLCSDGQPMTSPTKALMSLDLKFPEPGDIEADLNAGKLISKLKGVTGNELYNGFFGPSHVGDLSLLQCTGFGGVKVHTQKTAPVIGMCGAGDPGKEWKCAIVTSITGTLVGYPTQTGACGNSPMWDGCVDNDSGSAKYTITNDAVISGTWQIKFNNTLTKVDEKEAAILKKLGVTAENMYVVSE